MSLQLLIFILFSCSCVCAADTTPVADPRTTIFSAAFSKIINGVPYLGIEPIDPLYINSFKGEFVTLEFIDYRSTFTGLSNCSASNFILSSDQCVINFELDCPSYVLNTIAESKGYFLNKNVDGPARLTINYGRTVVRVYALLSYVTDGRLNTYYQIGRFLLDVEFLEPPKYHFKDLYNKDSAKTDEINQLANQNRASEIYAKNPQWYAIMKKLIGNLNKSL